MYSGKSSPFYTIETASNYSQHDYSFTSSDESHEEIKPVIIDVQNVNPKKTRKQSASSRTSLVVYGPIRIRKRHIAAPTLATGRRSKDDYVEGEDSVKREIRRTKNRESARNLKILRDNIEQQLQNQVSQLELEEKTLLTDVHNLQIYKNYLEEQFRGSSPTYEIISRSDSAVSYDFKEPQQQVKEEYPMEIKEEPRPPSPEWQLMFSI